MADYPTVPDGTIDWYYPEYGKGKDGSIADIVTHQPGVHKVLQYKAMGMGREAAAALAAHRHRGNAQVEVAKHPNVSSRSPDWYVYLVDADPGGEGKAGKNKFQRSAMSIEFGWTTKKGTEVPGLHILSGVMKRAARKYRGPK